VGVAVLAVAKASSAAALFACALALQLLVAVPTLWTHLHALRDVAVSQRRRLALAACLALVGALPGAMSTVSVGAVLARLG